MVHRKRTFKAVFRDGSKDCLVEGRIWMWVKGKMGRECDEEGNMKFGSYCRIDRDGVLRCSA